MNTNARTNAQTALTWVCSLSPYMLALTFIGMALHVRLGLGHWPRPMTEDYRTVAFQLHEFVLVMVGWFAVFLALPLGAILICCFQRFRSTVDFHVKQFALFGIGWLVIFLLAKSDPTTFTDWFLD